MENIFSVDSLDIILKLFIALFLGTVLGVERAIVGKTAGMRTYGLVTMGAALFTIVGSLVAVGSFESLRLTGQIITGIGFVGAGLIFFNGEKISGVTTAVGIWVSAGIGMAVGYGFYMLATLATLLALFAFTALWYVENKLKTIALHEHEAEE